MSRNFEAKAGSRQYGFTLLEVLVALVVTGLAVGAAFHLFGTAFKGQAHAERATSAILFAQSKLAETGAASLLAEGRRSGRTADGLRWQTEVTPYSDVARPLPDGLQVLAFVVTVTVSWDGRGDGITLRGMRLRPRRRDE
jgi:prepilin-type N-terminal cleavage/methylation domain-containing protein